MAATTLLEKVKASVRITDPAVATAASMARSEDIQGFIDACKDDLKRVGIHEDYVIDTNVRVIEACKLYVKWRLDYEGRGENYRNAYECFRDASSMNQDYLTEAGGDV